jgi:hypothetical protein
MPVISADGRYVAFQSTADNLSSDDDSTPGLSDIYVRDLQAETTTLVSRQSAADGGLGASAFGANPTISADGRYVGFESKADNLSAVDSDGITDVFVYDYLGDAVVPDPTPQPPPEPPPAIDTTPPGLSESSADSPQKLGKALNLTVVSDEDASVTATGTASTKGTAHKRAKTLKFKAVTAQVTAEAPAALKLKPSKRTARKLRAARRGKATITIAATDAANNSATRTLKVKLR